jgi:SulP family sulfate permease
VQYDTENLKGDISGGLVAGIIALPLALAFGVQSGLGAAAGLYGAIAVGVFAAFFGGTRTQASGPTGPMTVVSASIVVYAIDRTGSIEEGLGIILLSFLAGGVFQVGLGLIGIGKYIRYFPYPVVSGFMSGVGLIIIFLQLWPLLGVASPKTTIEVVTRIDEPLGALNGAALFLGLLTIAVNWGMPKVTTKVPSVLVALLVGTITAVVIGFDVPTIGDIPSGLPGIELGAILSVDPEYIGFIVQSGLTLALLGSIDSLLTSVIADNITKDRHDSRRELIGQGIGNSIAALFGGIPGAGATKGTVVNIKAGGVTRLSGVTHGLFQLAALLGLGALASYIPLSVLAGLLISVGFAIIDYKGLRHLLRVPRADAAVMLVVLVATVFGNLIYAVGAGVVMASVLFMKKAGDLAEERSRIEKVEMSPSDPAASVLGERSSIYVKELYGPLFFGFSSGFRDLAESLPEEIEALVVQMDDVPYVDQSGLYSLEDTMLTLRQAGKDVIITGLQPQPEDMLRRIGIVPELVPEEHLFGSIDELPLIESIVTSEA